MNAVKLTTAHRFQSEGVAQAAFGWTPLAALTAVAFIFGVHLPAWGFMWAIAFAMFYGCKWLTFWQNRDIRTTNARRFGYLFLWPGMDAKAFLDPAKKAEKPTLKEWCAAVITTCTGTILVWIVTRQIRPDAVMVQGWAGLIGLCLLLHFGLFRCVALAWRTAGVCAEPLMKAPILATSLAEFWGARWNSAFNRLVHDLIFRSVRRQVGIAAATLLVFLVSGIIHDLVISVPARGDWGLPTLYFLIQGTGLLFERSKAGKDMGLRRGLMGWSFTMLITAGPAYWLFHPAFISRVIVPFLHTINATEKGIL